MKKEITYEELQAAASYVQARLPYTPKVALVMSIGATQVSLASSAPKPSRKSFIIPFIILSSITISFYKTSLIIKIKHKRLLKT